MIRWPLIRVLALLAALASAAHTAAADDWWNSAWSHRKRVRVRLAPAEPLGFRYRPPAAGTDDLVAAQAAIQCEVKLAAGAAREIRVVDAGGNLLPCVAEDPDSHGLVRVTFPARRTIQGQLATPIQDGTKTVTLSVGRDKAVAPGTRFYALAGANRIATLEVEAVEAKTASARVIEKSTPNIAQGVAVESGVVTSAEYAIYYGNPKPEGEAPTWTPPSAHIQLYGWRITDDQFLNALEEARGTYRRLPVDLLAGAMRNSPSYTGSRPLTIINSPGNPLDYESYHISVYESYFRCDIPGLYRFSVDSGAPAYLFVNGKMMAQRASFFYQVAGNFEHRGKIQLDKGYHHLLLCAVESGKLCNTRLGWQPITDTTISAVPASFYLNRIEAAVVAFDTRDQRGQACFRYELAPLSVVADTGKRFQFVQFHGLLVPGEADEDTAFRWDFGDGATGTGEAPGHLYEVPKAGTAAAFPVTLHVSRDSKPAGEYRMMAHCEPRPSEKLNLSLDIVSFANVVYFDERTSVAVRLRNTGFSPVIVRATGRLENGDDKQVIVNQDLLIEGQNENFCILPVDMKQLKDKTALLELEILLGGQLVLDAGARAIPFSNLARRGEVALDGSDLVLGPGGPYTGVAYAGDFPTMDYEVVLHAQRRAGRDLCHVTFPVGSALCTLRPQAWNVYFEADRWYELRLRVTEAKVEAWLDGRKVTDVARAAAQTALPLAFDALKPFGVHAALNAQVAIRDISLARIGEPAGAPTPKAPAPKAPAKAPDAAKPASVTPLFKGSLTGWKPVAETDLNLLQRGLGSLHDYQGRRVMISTEIEDADRHLEHVFSRFAREKLFTHRRSVLLFGDRMSPPVAEGKTFPDYVTLLANRLAAAKRPFQFVERSTGLLPTLADAVLFARTLKAVDPLPDIVVISPGLADVQQAVGERDFTRTFDLMIDAVRATGKAIKVVLVSPPPCARSVRISRLYTETTAKLAREHHVQFLNLDTLFTQGQDDWLQAVYAAPEAQDIFLNTPNEAAHRRIANAIEQLIEP